jgi:hypothetical protein
MDSPPRAATGERSNNPSPTHTHRPLTRSHRTKISVREHFAQTTAGGVVAATRREALWLRLGRAELSTWLSNGQNQFRAANIECRRPFLLRAINGSPWTITLRLPTRRLRPILPIRMRSLSIAPESRTRDQAPHIRR